MRLVLFLLLAAAACDRQPSVSGPSTRGTPAPAALSAPPAAAGDPCAAEDLIEVRVDQFGGLAYARVESCGRVELAVHTWEGIEQFQRGVLPATQIDDLFQQVRSSGVLDLHEDIPADPSAHDPTFGQISVRMSGQTHLLHYSLRESPEPLQRLHNALTNPYVSRFPRNTVEGDYLRSYPLDLRYEVIPPSFPRFAMTAADLEAHAALRDSLGQPGRLIHAGPPGGSWERGQSRERPPQFFVDYEGSVYHVLVLEYLIPQEGPHD